MIALSRICRISGTGGTLASSTIRSVICEGRDAAYPFGYISKTAPTGHVHAIAGSVPRAEGSSRVSFLIIFSSRHTGLVCEMPTDLARCDAAFEWSSRWPERASAYRRIWPMISAMQLRNRKGARLGKSVRIGGSKPPCSNQPTVLGESSIIGASTRQAVKASRPLNGSSYP
jgi:hypothetical protein